jgi:peptidoglycan/LPS O-acetylase OafA/YrhL
LAFVEQRSTTLLQGNYWEQIDFYIHDHQEVEQGVVHSSGTHPQGFSNELHAMRGLAASAVVMFHALLIFRGGEFDDPHRLRLDFGEGWLVLNHFLIGLVNGHGAVILFFVLSGTVLALSLDRARRLDAASLASFYVRRGFRLFPLLIVVSLAAAALHIYYFDDAAFSSTTSWMGGYYNHVPTGREVTLNAVGLSNSLNAPAWTITVEIVASMVFPLLYVLSLRNRYILPTVVLLTIMLFTPAARDIHNYFLCFYLGALIPRLGGGAVAIFHRVPRIVRALATVGALLVLGRFERFTFPEVHMESLEVFAMTLAATFIVGVVYHGSGWSLLRSRLLMFLGEISYGIYLIHFGVLFVLAHLLAPHLSDLAPPEAILWNLALGAATLLVTIMLATITYYSFERPCQRLGRELSIQISERLTAHGSGVPQGQAMAVRRVSRKPNDRDPPPAE